MKNAIDILMDEVPHTGWNERSMLELACEYIDRQGDNACFKEFVQTQAEHSDEVKA